MRMIVSTALLLALSACGSRPEVEQCERAIRADLRSPSTYKKIKSESMAMKSKSQWWVIIEYDAANAYGTPIRDTHYCKYALKNGQADLMQAAPDEAIEPDDAEANKLDAVVANAL